MKKVLVVGDTMLDCYTVGCVNRNSPEDETVPVLDYEKTIKYLGGAANVATNLKTICSEELKIDYFGFLSEECDRFFSDYDINTFGVYLPQEEILEKNRFVNINTKQLLRVDKNVRYQEVRCKEIENIHIDYDQYDLICVSDYNKGTLRHLWGEIILCDTPKVIDIKKYWNYIPAMSGKNTVFKCNKIEYESNKHYFDGLDCEAFVVTLGSEGYVIKTFSNKTYYTTSYPQIKNKKPVSVVGAGDVFLAGMASNFLETNRFNIAEMCRFANKCSMSHVMTVKQTVDRRDIDERCF